MNTQRAHRSAPQTPRRSRATALNGGNREYWCIVHTSSKGFAKFVRHWQKRADATDWTEVHIWIRSVAWGNIERMGFELDQEGNTMSNRQQRKWTWRWSCFLDKYRDRRDCRVLAKQSPPRELRGFRRRGNRTCIEGNDCSKGKKRRNEDDGCVLLRQRFAVTTAD